MLGIASRLEVGISSMHLKHASWAAGIAVHELAVARWVSGREAPPMTGSPGAQRNWRNGFAT